LSTDNIYAINFLDEKLNLLFKEMYPPRA